MGESALQDEKVAPAALTAELTSETEASATEKSRATVHNFCLGGGGEYGHTFSYNFLRVRRKEIERLIAGRWNKLLKRYQPSCTTFCELPSLHCC